MNIFTRTNQFAGFVGIKKFSFSWDFGPEANGSVELYLESSP